MFTHARHRGAEIPRGTWVATDRGRPGAGLAGRHPDTALALEALLAGP